MRHSLVGSLLCVFTFSLATGCQVLTPRAIKVKDQYIAPELQSLNEPQIEVGRPNAVVDTIGNVVGIPSKVLLWDRRVDNHKVSPETLSSLTNYLDHNHLPHIKVRANQYAPLDEWRRLRKNKTVSPLIRYSIGALSVAQGAVLPGRIFGGDHFNPYTQSIHLFSDVPAIALHEGGHAKDFTRRKNQGLYALAYGFVPIWHETIASEDVYSYLESSGDQEMLAEADRILYPAYGTYLGSAFGNLAPAQAFPIYLGTTALGHLNGRMMTRQRMLAAKSALPAGDEDKDENIQLVSGETENEPR